MKERPEIFKDLTERQYTQLELYLWKRYKITPFDLRPTEIKGFFECDKLDKINKILYIDLEGMEKEPYRYPFEVWDKAHKEHKRTNKVVYHPNMKRKRKIEKILLDDKQEVLV